MTQVAPLPSLDFGVSAEQVSQITDQVIADELAINDQIAQLKPEEQTYENIVVPLARASNELSGKYNFKYINVLIFDLYIYIYIYRQGTVGKLFESIFS